MPKLTTADYQRLLTGKSKQARQDDDTSETVALAKTASPPTPTVEAADETDTDAKFEKGKPADPTKNMSPEDKAKWEKAKDEHKDQFKAADGYTRQRTTWGARDASAEHKAAGGLYGYTRKTQTDVEASVRKLQRRANSVARAIWKKDERVASFLSSHAKRASSAPARLLLGALKDMGPKVASQTLAHDSDQEEAWAKTYKTGGSYIEAADAFEKITRLLRAEKGPATRAFLKALEVGPDELLGREYFSVEVKKGDMEVEVTYGDMDAAMDNPLVQQIHKYWMQFLDYKAMASRAHRGGIKIPVDWPDSGVTAVGKDKGKYYALVQGMKTTYNSRERFIYAMKNEAQLPSRMVEQLLVQIDSGKRGSDKTAREFGLYGHRSRTATLGLNACAQIREAAGHISYDLHNRRQAKYALITGYLKEHSKAGKCRYSRLLLSSYPDAPPAVRAATENEDTSTKTASTPTGVEDWLAWE